MRSRARQPPSGCSACPRRDREHLPDRYTKHGGRAVPMTEFTQLATAVATAEDPSLRTAEFPVSAHAITTWCAAIGEENPLYLPERSALQTAPMSMLQTW